MTNDAAREAIGDGVCPGTGMFFTTGASAWENSHFPSTLAAEPSKTRCEATVHGSVATLK